MRTKKIKDRIIQDKEEQKLLRKYDDHIQEVIDIALNMTPEEHEMLRDELLQIRPMLWPDKNGYPELPDLEEAEGATVQAARQRMDYYKHKIDDAEVSKKTG